MLHVHLISVVVYVISYNKNVCKLCVMQKSKITAEPVRIRRKTIITSNVNSF